jgi:excisionase family DNA binding protein
MATSPVSMATLEDVADSLSRDPRLVDRSGRQLKLTPEVVEAFQQAIVEMQSPQDDLTTEATAALLGISRPTLIRLLNSGVLPYRRTQGPRGHRRIRRSDALSYLRADLERRRKAVDQLAADAEALGFFEK